MLQAQSSVVAEQDDKDAAKNTVGLSRLYPRVTWLRRVIGHPLNYGQGSRSVPPAAQGAVECASARRKINNGSWQVGRAMPWKGDVHQCACSRAASRLLCILRIFEIGPGEPMTFLVKNRSSSPSRCRMRGRYWAGGGAPAPPAVSSVRTPGPVSATKRTHQLPGTDRPSASGVHWQDHCHHQAEGQFQEYNRTTIMLPRRSVQFRQAILQQQGVVLPLWWPRIQSMTYDGGGGTICFVATTTGPWWFLCATESQKMDPGTIPPFSPWSPFANRPDSGEQTGLPGFRVWSTVPSEPARSTVR